jgi:hypothetical protein
VDIFGFHLDASAVRGARETVDQFRSTLTSRFQARRPDADAATWRIFEGQARAELVGLERADDEMLRMLLLTISGL